MTKFYDDGITVIAIITLILASISMISKLCYKSKCSNISCCYGLINIKRNVEIEIESEIETDIIPNKV